MDGLEATRPRPPALHADCALFLDVDGCLLDFASHPERVVVPAELRRRLRVADESLGGALALVSGRTVDALDALFAPLQLPIAGLHGHELRMRDGLRHRAPAAASMPAAVVADAAALCERMGALLEDKGASLALHWRNAPAAERPLRHFAEDALSRMPGYRLQPGHCVIELLPSGHDKGTAIATLLDQTPFRGRLPVFVGDDFTDEAGFREVNARGGISVLVGSRSGSAARHSLPDPASVRAWLGTLQNGGPA